MNKTRSIGPLASFAVAFAVAGAAAPVRAESPQAITITAQLVSGQTPYGTFSATGPICATGILELVDQVFAAGGAAFNVNALHRFVCDDNSGTFVIRLHPQGNARPKEGFELDGPFSIWGKGTGDYASLSGYGWFGVVIDRSVTPRILNETYVGFVTL